MQLRHEGVLVIGSGQTLPVAARLEGAAAEFSLASINGEVSLKLFKNEGRPTLSFANRDMPVFFLADTADVEVWGVVTWTLHQPRMS